MAQPIDVVSEYLTRHEVEFEVIEHEEAPTALGDARASGVEPADAAKEVVLRSDGGYLLAVIPASERLDLKKVRDQLEADERPRLATEAEIAARFPPFEVGAIPPFGPLDDAPELFDRRLLEHERVLCAGGDHRHSVRLAPQEIVRLAAATVADLCQE